MDDRSLDKDLVRMANQIARQFSGLPDDEAATQVANHLRSFWGPRMLAGLKAHVAKAPGDFNPGVLRATRILAKQ